MKVGDKVTCIKEPGVFGLGNNSFKQPLTYNKEYELVDVMNRDNLLIIAPSANDLHRTIPWKVSNRPRITIAFDIVPGRWIENAAWENHWIPIV